MLEIDDQIFKEELARIHQNIGINSESSNLASSGPMEDNNHDNYISTPIKPKKQLKGKKSKPNKSTPNRSSNSKKDPKSTPNPDTNGTSPNQIQLIRLPKRLINEPLSGSANDSDFKFGLDNHSAVDIPPQSKNQFPEKIEIPKQLITDPFKLTPENSSARSKSSKESPKLVKYSAILTKEELYVLNQLPRRRTSKKSISQSEQNEDIQSNADVPEAKVNTSRSQENKAKLNSSDAKSSSSAHQSVKSQNNQNGDSSSHKNLSLSSNKTGDSSDSKKKSFQSASSNVYIRIPNQESTIDIPQNEDKPTPEDSTESYEYITIPNDLNEEDLRNIIQEGIAGRNKQPTIQKVQDRSITPEKSYDEYTTSAKQEEEEYLGKEEYYLDENGDEEEDDNAETYYSYEKEPIQYYSYDSDPNSIQSYHSNHHTHHKHSHKPISKNSTNYFSASGRKLLKVKKYDKKFGPYAVHPEESPKDMIHNDFASRVVFSDDETKERGIDANQLLEENEDDEDENLQEIEEEEEDDSLSFFQPIDNILPTRRPPGFFTGGKVNEDKLVDLQLLFPKRNTKRNKNSETGSNQEVEDNQSTLSQKSQHSQLSNQNYSHSSQIENSYQSSKHSSQISNHSSKQNSQLSNSNKNNSQISNSSKQNSQVSNSNKNNSQISNNSIKDNSQISNSSKNNSQVSNHSIKDNSQLSKSSKQNSRLSNSSKNNSQLSKTHDSQISKHSQIENKSSHSSKHSQLNKSHSSQIKDQSSHSSTRKATTQNESNNHIDGIENISSVYSSSHEPNQNKSQLSKSNKSQLSSQNKSKMSQVDDLKEKTGQLIPDSSLQDRFLSSSSYSSIQQNSKVSNQSNKNEVNQSDSDDWLRSSQVDVSDHPDPRFIKKRDVHMTDTIIDSIVFSETDSDQKPIDAAKQTNYNINQIGSTKPNNQTNRIQNVRKDSDSNKAKSQSDSRSNKSESTQYKNSFTDEFDNYSNSSRKQKFVKKDNFQLSDSVIDTNSTQISDSKLHEEDHNSIHSNKLEKENHSSIYSKSHEEDHNSSIHSNKLEKEEHKSIHSTKLEEDYNSIYSKSQEESHDSIHSSKLEKDNHSSIYSKSHEESHNSIHSSKFEKDNHSSIPSKSQEESHNSIRSNKLEEEDHLSHISNQANEEEEHVSQIPKQQIKSIVSEMNFSLISAGELEEGLKPLEKPREFRPNRQPQYTEREIENEFEIIDGQTVRELALREKLSKREVPNTNFEEKPPEKPLNYAELMLPNIWDKSTNKTENSTQILKSLLISESSSFDIPLKKQKSKGPDASYSSSGLLVDHIENNQDKKEKRRVPRHEDHSKINQSSSNSSMKCVKVRKNKDDSMSSGTPHEGNSSIRRKVKVRKEPSRNTEVKNKSSFSVTSNSNVSFSELKNELSHISQGCRLSSEVGSAIETTASSHPSEKVDKNENLSVLSSLSDVDSKQLYNSKAFEENAASSMNKSSFMKNVIPNIPSGNSSSLSDVKSEEKIDFNFEKSTHHNLKDDLSSDLSDY